MIRQTALVVLLLICQEASAQTYRTANKKYHVQISENKRTQKISLSIKLYKGEQFDPVLSKHWDNAEKTFYYGGVSNLFKFLLYPKRDSLGNIPEFQLSVFYYGNGYQNVFTETVFIDDYYKEK